MESFEVWKMRPKKGKNSAMEGSYKTATIHDRAKQLPNLVVEGNLDGRETPPSSG